MVMSKRDRAQQVVLVVLGLLAVITNVWALVDYFLAGPRPTGGTAAPMFFSWCSRRATPPPIAA